MAEDVWGRTKETTLLDDWDSDRALLKERYIDFKNGKGVEKRDVETKEKISNNKEVNKRLD